MIHKRSLATASSIVGLSMAGVAQGAFVLVEDWEGYTVGQEFSSVNYNGADDGEWYQHTGNNNGSIVNDPDEGQVLRLAPGTNGRGYALKLGSNALPDGGVSTLFFRVNADGAQIFARLADGEVGSNWYQYDRTGTTVTSDPTIAGTTVTAGEWYNVWVVVDLANDLYDVYLSDGASALVQEDLSFSELQYPGAPTGTSPGTLDQFMLVLGNTHDGNEQTFVGDIWVDTSGENLSNPIPEPAAMALMGMGSLLMLSWRRA